MLVRREGTISRSSPTNKRPSSIYGIGDFVFVTHRKECLSVCGMLVYISKASSSYKFTGEYFTPHYRSGHSVCPEEFSKLDININNTRNIFLLMVPNTSTVALRFPLNTPMNFSRAVKPLMQFS